MQKHVLVGIGGLSGSVLVELYTYLFGTWSEIMTTLLIFMAFEYLTGIAVAVKGNSSKSKSGKLNSKVGWQGIVKKGITILIVLMACRLDLTAHQFGIEADVVNARNVVTGFFIGMEGISILENAKKFGIKKMPAVLTNALNKFIED